MASRRERSAEGSRGSMAGTFAAPWGAVKRARRVDRAASRLLRSMADSGLPGVPEPTSWRSPLHLRPRLLPRLAPGIAVLALGWAAPSGAQAPVRLALPLYDGSSSGPAYAATKFEVKLGGAGLVDRTRIATTARTGQAGIDALLTRYQVTRLEPEFPTAHDPDLSSYYVAHLPAGISLAAALGAFRAEPG